MGRTVEAHTVLRRARMHHRLSLREVERRIGRSNAYLSQVERGLIKQPNLIVLLELAELYGLNFETLASWARWVPAAPDPVGPHLRDSIRRARATLKALVPRDDRGRVGPGVVGV
jgi:transcriptional regulator with XRE-family HTH domain